MFGETAYTDYMVVMVPKKAFLGRLKVIAMVVTAKSQAGAIKSAQSRRGGDMLPDSSYKKPTAWLIQYGVPYYLS